MNKQRNSKEKVLIIEDEEVLLDVLQEKLKKEGYQVEVARDGEEGLIRTRSFKPDIVLLDIVMPKLDGFQFLEKMQQDEVIKNIPVMIISNSGQPVEIDRALKLGVKDYIIKTQFDPQEVLDKMGKILRGQASPTKPEDASAISQPPSLTEASEGEDQAAPGGTHQITKQTSADQKTSQSPEPAVAGGQKITILIVEDDKFLRDLLVHKLEEKNYQTEVAIDGQEGLKKIKQVKPDLVLLDLILPGVDGFGVLKQMRQDKRLDKIPVIILSNLGQQEEIERGLSLGAQDYLIKAHFTPQEVVARIKKILRE